MSNVYESIMAGFAFHQDEWDNPDHICVPIQD